MFYRICCLGLVCTIPIKEATAGWVSDPKTGSYKWVDDVVTKSTQDALYSDPAFPNEYIPKFNSALHGVTRSKAMSSGDAALNVGRSTAHVAAVSTTVGGTVHHAGNTLSSLAFASDGVSQVSSPATSASFAPSQRKAYEQAASELPFLQFQSLRSLASAPEMPRKTVKAASPFESEHPTVLKPMVVSNKTMNAWIQPFAGMHSVNTYTGVTGMRLNTMGTAFGLGYNYTPKVMVGALMGVSLASYDLANNSGNGKVNSYYTGIYTTYGKEGLILKASAIMGYSQYKAERKMNALSLVAKNSHTGWNGALRVQGGYGFSVNTFSVEPFTALGYSLARQQAYQENNANAFNLSVPASTTQVLRPEVGVKLQTSFTAHETIFQPLVSASIVKEYPIRKSASATLRFSDSTDTFQTPIPNETKTFGLLTTGCVAVLKNNLSLSGMVSGKMGRHEQGAEIIAKVSYTF